MPRNNNDSPQNKKRKQAQASLRSQAEEIINAKQKVQPETIEKLSSEKMEQTLHELKVHQIELEMQNEELRRSELELSKTKARYFELYNMAPVGYCTIDEGGLIIEANLTASTMLATARDTLVRQPFSNFIVEEDQDVYYLYRKKFVDTTGPLSCELKMHKPDGEEFWVQMDAIVVKKEHEPAVMQLTLSNISERKEMQKMLLIQSRQATMGEILAMIAHQWRQPLTIIGMSANILKISLELGEEIDNEELNSCIDQVNEQIMYLSQTIDDFRNYFKPDQSKEYVRIGDVLERTLAIIGKSLENNNIALNIQNNSQNTLLIFKNQLIQILLNVLNNANDALVGTEVSKPSISITIDELPESIVIKICDNAGGIAVSALDKISQPYFTTKALNGTGLGLYMSRIIIEKYFLGTLSWYNSGEGACFVLTLKKITT